MLHMMITTIITADKKVFKSFFFFFKSLSMEFSMLIGEGGQGYHFYCRNEGGEAWVTDHHTIVVIAKQSYSTLLLINHCLQPLWYYIFIVWYFLQQQDENNVSIFMNKLLWLVSLHVRYHIERSYLWFVVAPTCYAHTFLCQCVIEAC